VSRSNGLLHVLTLHCEEASELASRELDEALPALDRAALMCHLLVCRSCRRFRAQIHLIRDSVRRRGRRLAEIAATEGQLSPEARHRIAQACREADRSAADPEKMLE
jgi:hypothetical protein